MRRKLTKFSQTLLLCTVVIVVPVASPLVAQAPPKVSAKRVDTTASGTAPVRANDRKHDMHDMDGMAGMKGMQHMMPGKKEAMPTSGWKELDAYHALLLATWHPANEYGDIAPIRAKASALASAALTLASSTPPARCAAPKLVATAKSLAPQSSTIAEMVRKNATNNQIKDSLKALHERFEALDAGCSPLPTARK